tara:strand:+ start:218 stop:952 length:735 start_codon:yes stop_codon:yes gene_type:complete
VIGAAAQVCGLQTAATSARWAQHEQHDWYERGGGEGAAPLFERGSGDWRSAGGHRAPMNRPQPLAPRLPSADVVVVLAKAKERGRYIVAVSRPFDFGRRGWKLHSWPSNVVHQQLRSELERHNDQWAQLGPQGDLPHTCRPAYRARPPHAPFGTRAPAAAAAAAPPAAAAAAPADATAVPPADADAAQPANAAADAVPVGDWVRRRRRLGEHQISCDRFGLFTRLLISAFLGAVAAWVAGLYLT